MEFSLGAGFSMLAGFWQNLASQANDSDSAANCKHLTNQSAVGMFRELRWMPNAFLS